MIRSKFAVTRLIVLPYGALLALYLLVIGGGGAWLYFQVRAVETRLLFEEIMAAIEPLAEKLSSVDAVSLMQQRAPWLVADVQALFEGIPSLRKISVRGPDVGFQTEGEAGAGLFSGAVSPLPVDARRASTDARATQRLYAERDALFLIRFDLTSETAPLVRLDFGFDRSMMLSRVDEGLATIKQAIIGFCLAGGVSILLALVITMVAMRTTRRVEMHFQEIYQRASLSEMAAQLVHDLRNPLMTLRANAKALLVTPEQTREIVDELDQDIVALNDKLNAFLSLNRRHDDALEPVEIGDLIQDAVRLAQPVLAQHGVSVETDISPDLPKTMIRKASMRDALLNIIINAGQSGQTQGAIRVQARILDDALEIMVADQGKGIPEKHLPYLFDAFYTTRADGSGLGLAIVQRIVAAHQGKVRAENRPEGGVEVTITLPLQQQEAPHWWIRLKKTSPA